jgi:hypothetical protein
LLFGLESWVSLKHYCSTVRKLMITLEFASEAYV